MDATANLDLLNLFVAVADASSFSEGARRLGLPKSTASRGVARLEKTLGTQLLYRTTHAVTMTTAGAALYERVAPLVLALAEAVASVPEQDDTPSGTLRVTAANDLGAAVLGELVPLYLETHPEVTVDVRLTNAAVDLVADGIDLALRISTQPMQDSTLIARAVTTIQMRLFASPSYLARRGMPNSVAELADHDRVWPRHWQALAGASEARQRARIVADDFGFIRSALRAGGGVGPLPSFLARQDVERGTLSLVAPTFSAESGTLYLVHPPMRHMPAKVRSFRDFLREQLPPRMLASP